MYEKNNLLSYSPSDPPSIIWKVNIFVTHLIWVLFLKLLELSAVRLVFDMMDI